MSTSLEIRGLSKRYGGVMALQDCSHVFTPGQITSIVGPSGSGKSTTLALIAGLLRPDAGTIWCEGRDITSLSPERRAFGVVFQSYALFPHMSVRQNVEFGLRVRTLPRAERERRAARVLERVQIQHLQSRRVDELSGGEQQRVALARALAFDPRVLMLDEPLSALDARLRDTLRNELFRLLPELGITTLYITHDQVEAMSLAREIVVMNGGRIEQTGRPRDVYARPANEFVASFLGAANLIEGRVSDRRKLELPCCSVELTYDAPNEPCWAVLRPEDVTVVPAGRGLFDATVTSFAFLGDRVRLGLAATGCSLVADASKDRTVAVGSALGVKLQSDPYLLPRSR